MNIKKLMGNPVYLTAKTLDPGVYHIKQVEIRPINEEDRLVCLLEETDADLRLTPHQVLVVARAFGDEAKAWIGKGLRLSRGEPGISVEPVTEPEPPADKE